MSRTAQTETARTTGNWQGMNQSCNSSKSLQTAAHEEMQSLQTGKGRVGVPRSFGRKASPVVQSLPTSEGEKSPSSKQGLGKFKTEGKPLSESKISGGGNEGILSSKQAPSTRKKSKVAGGKSPRRASSLESQTIKGAGSQGRMHESTMAGSVVAVRRNVLAVRKASNRNGSLDSVSDSTAGVAVKSSTILPSVQCEQGVKGVAKKSLRTRQTETARSDGQWGGMNWIRQEKRLAIYLRDGLACVYCQQSVEAGAALSLDHVKPHSKGGSNHEVNLVTCCTRCNSSRGDRSLTKFAQVVSDYTDNGTTAADIIRDVRNKTARKLAPFKIEAAALIARRGSSAKALAKLS